MSGFSTESPGPADRVPVPSARDVVGAVFVRPDKDVERVALLVEETVPGDAAPGEGSRFSKTMSREGSGPLCKTLDRLWLAVSSSGKKTSKKSKKNKNIAGKVECTSSRADEANIFLIDDGGGVIDGKTCNREAFRTLGRFLYFRERGWFEICVDSPRIIKVSLRGKTVQGCPCVPIVETEFCQGISLEWEWRILDDRTSKELSSVRVSRVVSRERVYRPIDSDVGGTLHLSVRTVGQRFSSGATLRATSPVHSIPELTFAFAREKDFKRKVSTSRGGSSSSSIFKVVSYNVLADAYNTASWDDMYGYCPSKYLSLDYRLPLLLREVVGFNADIVCLQEVDEKAFETWRVCLGEICNLVGRFTPKTGKGAIEGCAVFWRSPRFRLVDFEDFSFREKLSQRDRWPPWLTGLVEAVPSMQQTLDQVSTIAQLIVLRDLSQASEHAIVLGNTHSFYHPGAGSVRAVQMKVLVDEIADKMHKLCANESSASAAAVLCGDLNAQSFDVSVQFLLDGRVGAQHPEWATSSLFEWGNHANLARDSVFDDSHGQEREPDVLVLQTGSGRFIQSKDLEKQVDKLTAEEPGHCTQRWKNLIGLVGDLKHAREIFDSSDQVELIDRLLVRVRARLQQDRQRLISDHEKFVSSNARRDENDVAIGVGANLAHALGLESAYGTPEFTNFCKGFQGDLDWIFFQRHKMELVTLAELPSKQTVTEHVALPSPLFPSDHVSLCCALDWKH